MADESPRLPVGRPPRFRATVHGTVFGSREHTLERIKAGDRLRLHPDPLEAEEPDVWVHLGTGDLVGHLPREIGMWLAPWLRGGGVADATALRVEGQESPSWRRLLLEVRCHP